MPVPRQILELPQELPSDVEKLRDLIRAQQAIIRQLALSVERLERYVFGKRSEKLDPPASGQEDLLAGQPPPAPTLPEPVAPEDVKPVKPRGHGRQTLPAELPRKRVEYEPCEADKTCTQCASAKSKIGEEVTEQLEYVPASLFVVEHVCAKYACLKCQGQVVQAEKPAQPIEKGLAGPGLLAYVTVSKYADHLPLHRLESIFARHGVDLSRQTLSDWMMRSADLLKPLYELMKGEVLRSVVINTDDTLVPVQDRKKTHEARLWVYLGDDDHPYTLYDFTKTRCREGPETFLGDYRGYLQADAYAGYNRIYHRGATEVGCWVHGRRKFVEAAPFDQTHAPHALQEIARLYEIEKRARELEPADRQALRQAESLPIIEELFAWMEKTVLRVLPKSPTAQAIGYMLSLREALTRYVYDGRLSIDNNAAERAMRPVAIGRKNWLFAGSERGGHAVAILYSVIQSARRHKINLFSYLRELFERMPTIQRSKLSELLPDKWNPIPVQPPISA